MKKKEYKVLYISEIRKDILKALRKHSYYEGSDFGSVRKIVRLEKACSVVRYHLNKVLK